MIHGLTVDEAARLNRASAAQMDGVVKRMFGGTFRAYLRKGRRCIGTSSELCTTTWESSTWAETIAKAKQELGVAAVQR